MRLQVGEGLSAVSFFLFLASHLVWNLDEFNEV